MFRATTPVNNFLFNVDPDATFKQILITYAQRGKIILEKTKEDLTFSQTDDGYVASFRLTQKEANLFNARNSIEIQVRALSYYNEAIAFTKTTMTISDVLNDVVLT